MSAYIVDKAHIDALVAAGLRPKYGSTLRWYWNDEAHELTRATADRVGGMLLSENVRSVDFRYSPPGREAIYGEGFESDLNQQLPGTYREESPAPGIAPVSFPEWLTPYVYREPRRAFSPVAILKALDCFTYQSCETDDWPETEASAFCRALRDWCVCKLEGYDEADWTIS